MPKIKKIIVHFPDSFKFPQYHQEENIEEVRTITLPDAFDLGELIYKDMKNRTMIMKYSQCSRCPFDYDSIACRLTEDGTDEPKKCPFYDSDEYEFYAE